MKQRFKEWNNVVVRDVSSSRIHHPRRTSTRSSRNNRFNHRFSYLDGGARACYGTAKACVHRG